jgi:nitrogen fixation protein NifU and related proteins
VSAFSAAVLEHFKHPRNRGALASANASADGANPLCGDRVRVELLVDAGRIVDARFTADACAVCIASASIATEWARGRRLMELSVLECSVVHEQLGGAPAPGRERCLSLPLDTLRRAAAMHTAS